MLASSVGVANIRGLKGSHWTLLIVHCGRTRGQMGGEGTEGRVTHGVTGEDADAGLSLDVPELHRLVAAGRCLRRCTASAGAATERSAGTHNDRVILAPPEVKDGVVVGLK